MFKEVSIIINKPPVEVFQFLCDKNSFEKQGKTSANFSEKSASSLNRTGSKYRGIIRLVPLIEATMSTEITIVESNSVLEEKCSGGGIQCILIYFFYPLGEDGTHLIQQVIFNTHWLLKPLEVIIAKAFYKTVQHRLDHLKNTLEAS